MKMTRSLLAGVAASALLVPALADQSAASLRAEAQGLIKEFFTTLKGELEGALAEGGPVYAVGFCKERAPAIAQGLSEESGWDVGRTSLRLRNPALNAPDAWEEKVLLEFEERKARGEPVKDLSYAQVVTTDSGESYRFMKAIPTGEICLACHGDAINPDIAAAIDAAYPKDQAKGFALGDIRGAFTLSKPL